MIRIELLSEKTTITTQRETDTHNAHSTTKETNLMLN